MTFTFSKDFDEVEFDRAYRRWLCEGQETRPKGEEIERVYRQMTKHVPTICPHGKTILTCSECYFSGWRG